MCNQYTTGLPQVVSIAVHVMRLRAAAVVFQNAEVLSLPQVFYGKTFDIVSSIEEFSGEMADVIEYSEQSFILLPFQTDQLSSSAEIECW